MDTADPGVELGFGSHPAEMLLRINEEGEDGCRAGHHHDLTG
jgi:hypothetical protein